MSVLTWFCFVPQVSLAADPLPSCLCYYKITKDNVAVGNYCSQLVLTEAEQTRRYRENPQLFCSSLCSVTIKDYGNQTYLPTFVTSQHIDDPEGIQKNAVLKCQADVFVLPASATTSVNTRPWLLPKLETPIPGITFTAPTPGADGKIDVDFIGQYFSGLYQWLLGVAVTIAIVMIMVGGVQYILAGEAGKTKEAKERISNAAIGFILLLCTYVILFVVNPQFTALNPISLRVVKPIAYDGPIGDEPTIAGALAAGLNNPTSPQAANIVCKGGDCSKTIMTEAMKKDLEAVAAAMAKEKDDNGNTLGLVITSAFRDPAYQLQLANENCEAAGITQGICVRKPGKSIACVPNKEGTNCPHTTGAAVDVWAACQNKEIPNQWFICVSQSDITTCKNPADVKLCQKNKYQEILIKKMIDQGYCLWAKEAWHFEKPSYSKPCYTP